MTESSLEPPAKRDVNSLADWIEVTMFIECRDYFPKSTIGRRLSETDGDLDADLSLAISEIRRRARLANALYPFDVDVAGVEKKSVPNRFYEFLLACTVEEFPFRQERNWAQVVPTFERLATAALGAFYGAGTCSLRFGTPPEPERPSQFTEALPWLAEKLQVASGHLAPKKTDNDGGVDVVAWRPFRDARSGFPVTLAQCTIQTDYERKGADISTEKWRAWLHFNRDPQIALIIPFSLGNTTKGWENLHFSVDLILDRFRLCELLESINSSEWSEGKNLEAWLDNQLSGMRLED